MITFSYRSGNTPNEGVLEKAGLDKPEFAVDFTDGIPSGVTLSSATVGAVNAANADVTTQCISSVTTTGATTPTLMATCSTGGTAAATNGDRFRLRTTVTLSNSRTLIYDVYVYIANPAYDPT